MNMYSCISSCHLYKFMHVYVFIHMIYIFTSVSSHHLYRWRVKLRLRHGAAYATGIYSYTFIYTQIHSFTFIYIRVHLKYTLKFIHLHSYTFVYIYVYIHVNTIIYIRIHLYISSHHLYRWRIKRRPRDRHCRTRF